MCFSLPRQIQYKRLFKIKAAPAKTNNPGIFFLQGKTLYSIKMYSDRSDEDYDSKCPPIHMFGPVNVTVLRDEQCFGASGDLAEDNNAAKTVGSAVIGFAYLLIGANMMLTYIYTIHWHLSFINNLHIFLCSSGFQLLIPMGILVQCKVNGPSHTLPPIERTRQHMLLQLVGVVSGVIGGVFVIFYGEMASNNKWSLHCITGIVTCLFALLSMFTGIVTVAFEMRANFLTKHPVYGIVTYFMSSICFILGTRNNDFVEFVPMSEVPDVIYIIIVFCALSTLVVIYFPIRHILTKLV